VIVPVRVLVAAALAALSIAACATSPGGPSSPADAWAAAERWAPKGATNPPIVVLLHGCAGIGPGLRNWGRVLRDAGHLVIAPDSFARHDRAQWCDPRTHTTPREQRIRAQALRAEEIAYALIRVREMAPPKAILMGHSEGGNATMLDRGGWDAYVVSGSSCRGLRIPHDSPTLLLSYETDPWVVAGGGTNECPAVAASRPHTKAYTAPGHGHDLGFDAKAQAAVVSFLSGLAR
jgi:dienelactone hydrolase